MSATKMFGDIVSMVFHYFAYLRVGAKVAANGGSLAMVGNYYSA
jgi:hypothetical protein